MRTTLVVVNPPSLQDRPGLADRVEPVRVQAFVSQWPVERLNKAIVGRFAGTAEVQTHLMVVDPHVHKPTGELVSFPVK